MDEPMEVIDLSSDDEGNGVPVTGKVGVVAADSPNLNQIKVEKPALADATSHGSGNQISTVTAETSNVNTGTSQSDTNEDIENKLSKDVKLPNHGDKQAPCASNQSTDADPKDNSDDDIEFIQKVEGEPRKVVENKLFNLGNQKFYQEAVSLFKRDPQAMRKMVTNILKKTDLRYCDTVTEVSELKARQEYRAKEIEELKNRYKTLQNDVYRLGNPLDRETQCSGEAEWDAVDQTIRVNGSVLREVRVGDVESSRKLDAITEPNEEIELSDDEVQRVADVIDIQNLSTGPPAVFDIKPSSNIMAAEDPKMLNCSWSPAQITEEMSILGKPFYKLIYDKPTLPNLTVPKECVVVAKMQPVKYPVKMRVVAGLRSSPESHSVIRYMAGFIGELPIAANGYKYLVLFDSGDACYVPHSDIFANFEVTFEKIVSQLKLNPDTEKQAKFLESYFERYPERLLVIPSVNEKIRVMIKDLWYSAKVKTSRQSLMQVRIKRLKALKWIFRGSYHLKPIFDALFPNQTVQNASKVRYRQAINPSSAVVRRSGHARMPRKNYVTRTREITLDSDSDESVASNYSGSSTRTRPEKRATFARKTSSTHPERAVLERIQFKNDHTLRFIVNEVSLEPQREHADKYSFHYCSNRCLRTNSEKEYEPKDFREVNPYCVPLILGWSRELRTVDRSECISVVCYKAPCGKSLLDLKRLEGFLIRTKSQLPISLFSFDAKLELFTDEESLGCYYLEEDLSVGLEPKAISVINQYDKQLPKKFKYLVKPTFSGKLIQEKAVALDNHLFFDQRFNSCCSCTDQCRDAAKCECQQLTKNQCKVKYPGQPKQWHSGYQYKLSEHFIETGIFECNPGCLCDELRCYNRVASLGVQHRLQLFKTAHKGWGVRTLHDIPPGSFVCAYVARILTPEEGNDDSNSDVYFADLDLLTRLESLKEDLNDRPDDYVSSGESNDSDEDDRDWRYDTGDSSSFPRRRERDYGRQRAPPVMFKIQEYLGDDCAYVMDANEEGNIGRYFNHSCDPNAYVQNIFIHTHDPRFPMIALFTARLVKAMEEITWDYGYTVGAVPGRELWCQCGARRCRRRLL